MAQRTAAQALIATLEAHGVDTIFGIISSHTMEIFDALYDRTDAIRFISARHEHAAAMMADAYARVSGKPGVCLTSTGPGAANSMGGLGEAYFASSPVLNITSTAEEELYERGLGTIHETKDQLGMFASVTQAAYHVSRPEDVSSRINDAFKRFATLRPRPISIQIPVDIQGTVADIDIPEPWQPTSPTVETTLVAQAADLLLSGKRVGILAGTGVHRAGAVGPLTHLAEILGAPVFTTPNGKGAVSEDHELCLGMHAGEYNFPPGDMADPRRSFANSLDTLLVVGSSLSWFRVRSQGLEQPPNLIHIDIDSESIGRWYETTVGLVGDANAVLKQLNIAIAGMAPQPSPKLGAEIEKVKTAIARYKRKTMPGETVIMETVREATQRDAIFVGDVSICNHRGSNYCLESYSERGYITPAWGGLGFGLPAAVGAKAAAPKKQVVCVTGDGGFQFNLQELATCVQYGLNPIILLFNDNAWGLLRQFQKAKERRYIASDLQNPDFVKLAEAYGCRGLRVSRLADLEPALKEALDGDTVALIEVMTPDGFASFA